MNPLAKKEALEAWVWVPFEVDRAFGGFRVDRFLAARLAGYSRTKIQKMLSDCRVVREGLGLRASAKVRAGDHIAVAYPRRPEPPLADDAALEVLFEDEELLIVNKPSGLLSHPTDKIATHTVLGYLRHSLPEMGRVHLLHRLDRETSGVLALAKTPRSARVWTRAMEARQIQKEYLAFARGVVAPAEGRMDWPIGRENGDIKVRQWINAPDASPAATDYRVERLLSRAGETVSFVRAFPRTGRLHQIRVHFAALGNPLLGDPLYTGDGAAYRRMIAGRLTAENRAALGFPRVALHAAALAFDHPATGRRLRVEAPLPPDMQAFLLPAPER